jgi:hypothetical protein
LLDTLLHKILEKLIDKLRAKGLDAQR